MAGSQETLLEAAYATASLSLIKVHFRVLNYKKLLFIAREHDTNAEKRSRINFTLTGKKSRASPTVRFTMESQRGVVT